MVVLVSRKYDESLLYLPEEIPYEDDGYKDGVYYHRIEEFPDYYITSTGEVISFRKKYPRIINQHRTAHGHLYVDLYNTEGRKRFYVHRLMAMAFIPNPNNHPVVRHLDDDPSYNYLGNLAWGTPKDNSDDMYRNGHDYRRGVYCYELDKHYISCAEVAREMGVDRSNVTMCCRGYNHTLNGMHFCYEDDIKKKMNDPNWLKDRSAFKPLVAISPEGDERYFASRSEASKELNMPLCGISSVIHGAIKHYHGWRFMEAN